jgi:hypothetical protein
LAKQQSQKSLNEQAKFQNQLGKVNGAKKTAKSPNGKLMNGPLKNSASSPGELVDQGQEKLAGFEAGDLVENPWKNLENSENLRESLRGVEPKESQEIPWKNPQDCQRESSRKISETSQDNGELSMERRAGKKERKMGGLMNGRPAVIMAGYSKEKAVDDGLDSITFGFDIDEHLLHSSDEDDGVKGLETSGLADNMNKLNNNCDINLNSSSNCNELDVEVDENLDDVEENNATRLSSNLIKNQSSPMLEEPIELEVSQMSSDLGYMSLVTNPSPRQQQQQVPSEEKMEKLNHFEEDRVKTLPIFIQPDQLQSFTFNHEKIVHFVGEGEWLFSTHFFQEFSPILKFKKKLWGLEILGIVQEEITQLCKHFPL